MNEATTYYYLKIRGGIYRIMKRVERSKIVCSEVDEAYSEGEAMWKVKLLSGENENAELE